MASRDRTAPAEPGSASGRTRGRAVVELAIIAVAALALVAAIQAWVLTPYRIPSASMQPSLAVGERILVSRIGLRFQKPRIGDIMVFHPPADDTGCADLLQGPGAPSGQACDTVGHVEGSVTFVKRVVGVPGDRLQIIDGQVIVNGHPESRRGIVPCPDNSACSFPRAIVVPPGDYYMMGDNRPDSEDSRFWGPVPAAWLIGYVFAAYWPLSRIGTI
ncbi:signal peptidase I [Conexibacter sp. DBS9H8]|uniref:signal peptidase I n=1 Tax=Conexibacter sp. DBS9H8 TaxID=2937801 RepID=UPI00200F16BB|nr:signal peptidase I [Conexibacter sp. DBS9H8]